MVVKNPRIVAQWWTSSEGHLLRLYFGVFRPSVDDNDYYDGDDDIYIMVKCLCVCL